MNEGANATSAARRAAADAGGGVADDRDRVHDRTGCDLPERDRVEELRVGHPVVVVDGVALHQRDDHEPAAVGERADLERHPHQRRAPRRSPERSRRAAATDTVPSIPDGPRALRDDFREATAQEHEHEPRAERRG